MRLTGSGSARTLTRFRQTTLARARRLRIIAALSMQMLEASRLSNCTRSNGHPSRLCGRLTERLSAPSSPPTLRTNTLRRLCKSSWVRGVVVIQPTRPVPFRGLEGRRITPRGLSLCSSSHSRFPITQPVHNTSTATPAGPGDLSSPTAVPSTLVATSLFKMRLR